MTPSFLGATLVHGLRGDDASEGRWLELVGRVSRQCEAALHSFGRFVLPRIALHRGDVDGAVRASGDNDAADGGLFHSYAEAMRIEAVAMSGADDADEQLDHPSSLVTENDFASAMVDTGTRSPPRRRGRAARGGRPVRRHRRSLRARLHAVPRPVAGRRRRERARRPRVRPAPRDGLTEHGRTVKG